jgi:predicted RNase H-like HicB family nuclease
MATGATREEVERNYREALEAHLAFARERGEPVPQPSTEVGTVAVAA